jgi:hypothetical protein
MFYSLKTRERYVELAEDSLTAKKVHCMFYPLEIRIMYQLTTSDVQVVDAFKKALSLLGR